MLSSLWKGRGSRQGIETASSMVETALVFPLLLMVAIGLVQFALYVHAQNVVTAAVQDGARRAAAEDGTLDAGLAQAQALLRAGLGAEASGVSVQGGADEETVVIVAQGRLHTIIPWVADATLPLQSRATVSREGFRVGPRP